MLTTIDIYVMAGFLVLLASIASFLRKFKKDAVDENRELIKMNVKLEQICATTNETRTDIKALNGQIEKVKEEQIAQKIEIREIWRNIGDLKNEIQEDVRK